MAHRVVITGIGAVSPLGLTAEETWQQLKLGKSGVTAIQQFDSSRVPVKIAGEVRGLDLEQFMERREIRKMARFSQLFMVSSLAAVADSQFQKHYSKEDVAVILGNGIGGFEIMEEAASKLAINGYKGVPPLSIPKLISNEGAANVAIHFGFVGPCYSIVTACASGTDAIGAAFLAVRSGQVKLALSGGAESTITELALTCFSKLSALAREYNDQPEKASRPFDKNRSGFVIGEGSGSIVLEELEAAKKRGAKIYAEVLGYGMTCDAHHLTAPDPTGAMAAQAMAKALQMGEIRPEQVGYINAHGTSTQLNDRTETLAIKQLFGEHAKKLKVSSLKSMTGHMIGGAGAVELIATSLSLRDRFVHPTINYETVDEDCDLDYVPNQGQELDFDYALSNSLGFGGHNGSLLIGRYQDES